MSKLSHVIYGIRAKKQFHETQRNPAVWVFGEWFGERCCDNSKYFANYMASFHPEIKVKWIAKCSADTSSLDPNIECLKMDSNDAQKALSECGVAIISQGFQDLSTSGLNYVSGAVSVHLWHGIPWKRIGHDGSRKKSLIVKAYQKLSDYAFGTDYYASPSDEYDKVACSAHGATQKQIIHAGYARNSVFYSKNSIAEGKKRIVSELERISPGFDFSQCRIISYMPTFRNDSTQSFSFEKLWKNEQFTRYLDEHNVIVIQKAHFVNQMRDGRTEVGGADRIYSLNNIAAQDLLCASDLLVTDYSGAFFDFLILDRPIIHYLYDYDYYRTQDRGLYYDKESVIAGEEADDEEQLVNAIIRNLENPDLYQERRHKIRSIYMKYDTPDSCEVLYQAIIKELKRRDFNESTDS